MTSGGSELAAGVRPGDVLAGKYRVERVLGAGGMGVVVAAHHLQLDERVALKFLLPEALKNAEAVGRFDREARAAVKIKSEHVARVIDVGRLENGAPYMVMEYLEGADLSAWLAQRGAMPVEQAVDFVLQACEAIAEAHALGIVHRDLKPANLFCIRRADGQLSIKVLDFGISKVTTPGTLGHDMTSTSAIVGSPLYMSPEQLQSSKDVDTRTDIWSLGVILFELLAGRVPFVAEAVTELVIKIATEPCPPVRSMRGDVPPGLEQIIAICLQKERDRRFANVGELAIALRDYASKRARGSVERIIGTLRAVGMTAAMLPASGEYRSAPQAALQPPSPATAPNTVSTWGRTRSSVRPPSSSAAAVWIVVGVVAVVGLGVGGAAFLKSRAGRPALGAAAAVPASSTSTPTPPATASAPITPAPAADTGVDVPPATPSGGPPAETSAVTPSRTGEPPRASSPPWRAPGAAPRSIAPAPTAKAAVPGCDPPYTLDDQGRKHFKAECFLQK